MDLCGSNEPYATWGLGSPNGKGHCRGTSGHVPYIPWAMGTPCLRGRQTQPTARHDDASWRYHYCGNLLSSLLLLLASLFQVQSLTNRQHKFKADECCVLSRQKSIMIWLAATTELAGSRLASRIGLWDILLQQHSSYWPHLLLGHSSTNLPTICGCGDTRRVRHSGERNVDDCLCSRFAVSVARLCDGLSRHLVVTLSIGLYRTKTTLNDYYALYLEWFMTWLSVGLFHDLSADRSHYCWDYCD